MKHLSRVTAVCLIVTLGLWTTAGAVERTHDIVPEDYFTEIFLAGMSVSPDGGTTAYVDFRWNKASDGRGNDIWVVDNQTLATTRLTFDPGNETSPQWSPDGRWIYFMGHYKSGSEDIPATDGSSQVWRIHPDGGELMAVTRVADGIDEFILTKDGSAVFYTKSKDHLIDEWKDLRSEYKDELIFGHGVDTVSELWKLDLTSWRSEMLLDPTLYINEFAVSPDGRRIAMITTPDGVATSLEGESNVLVFNTQTGVSTMLPDKIFRDGQPNPHGWLVNPAWSSDGNKLAFSIDFDGYPSQVFVADLSNGETAAKMSVIQRPGLVNPAGNVEWVPGKDMVAFLGDWKARKRVYAVDFHNGNYETLTTGDVVCDGFDFAGEKGDLVAIQSTLTYYHDLVYCTKKDSRRITHLNPQVDTWKLPQISIVKWVGAKGDTVEGILELPPDYQGGEKLPLLVAIHGGPTLAEPYSFLFWIYGRASFAARGWAMLSPNYRGSTGYGDEFLTDLIGHENDYDVTDIMTGVDYLINQGIVDENRMGVSGWSNGGFLTNCLIASNRFKAASSGAGVFDQTVELVLEDTPNHVVNYNQGLPWETPDSYRRSSPIYTLHPGITTAVLIHAGEKDQRVPVANSLGLHRMLTRYLSGAPCELVIYPGAGHNLTKYSHRLAKMRWDQVWFDKYVLGTDDGE